MISRIGQTSPEVPGQEVAALHEHSRYPVPENVDRTVSDPAVQSVVAMSPANLVRNVRQVRDGGRSRFREGTEESE